MLNEKIIKGYAEMCSSIERILEVYHIPKKAIYEGMGWSRQKFYNRLKQADFSPKELLEINAVIKKYRRMPS